jgi:hypothetical protein
LVSFGLFHRRGTIATLAAAADGGSWDLRGGDGVRARRGPGGCSETYYRVAADSIQVHGGIGTIH